MFFCLILLAGCAGHSETGEDEGSSVIATVNATSITLSDFERTYVSFLLQTGANDTPEYRYVHLQNLLDMHLLAAEARRQGLDRDSTFLKFKKRVWKKAVGGRFYERAFLETLPPPTDADIREAFFRYKQQVVVRHLFYRAEMEALHAYQQLQGGRDFLDLAQECYNTARYDSLAGFLGPVRYFAMDDAFAEVAFTLDVGTYSSPVKSRYGYHIIRVEDRITNPIITESGYQMRKAGIASQFRLRKRRLEGDQFVRTYMENLGVQVRAESIYALAEALRILERRVVAEAPEITQDMEMNMLDRNALRAQVTPETILATYHVRGEERTFTGQDYYVWLPDLPFAEARHHTAASVGRALRNEVFAAEGTRRGLTSDSVVLREVQNQSDMYLANALLARIRTSMVDASSSDMRTQEQQQLEKLRIAASISVDTLMFENSMIQQGMDITTK